MSNRQNRKTKQAWILHICQCGCCLFANPLLKGMNDKTYAISSSYVKRVRVCWYINSGVETWCCHPFSRQYKRTAVPGTWAVIWTMFWNRICTVWSRSHFPFFGGGSKLPPILPTEKAARPLLRRERIVHYGDCDIWRNNKTVHSMVGSAWQADDGVAQRDGASSCTLPRTSLPPRAKRFQSLQKSAGLSRQCFREIFRAHNIELFGNVLTIAFIHTEAYTLTVTLSDNRQLSACAVFCCKRNAFLLRILWIFAPIKNWGCKSHIHHRQVFRYTEVLYVEFDTYLGGHSQLRRGTNTRPWGLSCVLRPWGLGRRTGRIRD